MEIKMENEKLKQNNKNTSSRDKKLKMLKWLFILLFGLSSIFLVSATACA